MILIQLFQQASTGVKLSLNVGRIQNEARIFWINQQVCDDTQNDCFDYVQGKDLDTPTLNFEYVVQEGHKTSNLRITDLVMETDGFIRRKSTNPTTGANVTIPPFTLITTSNGSDISVDGQVPHVVDIFFVPGQSGRVFKKKENISIAIDFDSRVILKEGPPVLLIGRKDSYREAFYVSGNRSSCIIFNYTVEIGDSSLSSSIFCKMICVASGCLEGVSREGYILQYSSKPVAAADLSLPATREG